ncbi:MAG: hypothetical protein J6Y78_16235 [Paludibacteraceae bacterium]|nr:hypothetical protein [Paludibacteraceae bacterium]
MSDFVVKIEYKNKNLETVIEKEYSFIDYTEMLNLELKRILMDVEDAFYYLSGNKQKDEWDSELTEKFNKIRHKLLDQANAIKRLPENLSYKDIKASTMPFSEFLARTIK